MALGALMKADVKGDNHAMNGRSTKSFLDEGRWAKLTADLTPGDFVIERAFADQ